MKRRVPGREQLKTGQIHFAAYGGHVYHVSEGGRSAVTQEFQLNIIALLEF